MKNISISFKGQSIFTKFYVEKIDTNKPTIVFLHEALGSVAQWRDFPGKVVEITSFNAVAYDRLGHGLSDFMLQKRDFNYLQHEAWEVLPSVLEQLGIKNPILWGHSDGGSIALLHASRFSTQALITEAAHVLTEKITIEGIQKALTRKAFLIERLARFHRDKTADLFAAWSDTWLQDSFKNWNIEAILKDINCPSLIIQGENDEYGSIEQVHRIVKGVGQKAQKVIIPDCGHIPHKESTENVLNHFLNFINHHV
jgi:pimeloyl-ACP methyl ester carboxylesterase